MTARAAEPATDEDWRYSASVYLWGAGLNGETAAGSEVDVGFDTLIQNLDIGTGRSNLTWQASTGLAYRFSGGDVSLVYRHIDWEFDSSSRLDNIRFSRPLLAAKFRF
jgi:hypothetical protein